MQLTIKENNKNVLLQRHEIKATVSFEGATPGNVHVAEAIGKQLGIDATLVVVKQIKTQFSHQHAICSAMVYLSAEAKKKAEKVPPHIRKKEKEANKAAPQSS